MIYVLLNIISPCQSNNLLDYFYCW